MRTDQIRSSATEGHSDEILALARTLEETHQRLRDLTGGQVDAVVYPGGGSFLLQEAQEKLRKSEAAQRDLAARQSSILNALPAHIALIDDAGTIISVNDGWRGFAERGGLQSSSCGVGQNYLEICERAEGSCAEEALAAATGIRAVLTGAAKGFEIEYPCHSPTEQRWFQLMVTSLGKAPRAGATIMHIDITSRKLMERQALEQTELIKLASSVGKLGAWAIECADSRIVWSDEVRRIHEVESGFEPDLASALDFFPPASRKKLSEAVASGQPYDLELDFITAKGNKLWVRTTGAIETKNGAPHRIYGVLQDITERKKTEARNKRLIDSNAQGVLFWKTDGKITGANDAFLSFVGYTREDLEAGHLDWKAMTPPEYVAFDRQALAEISVTGVCKSFEKEFIRKDGSRVPVVVGATAFEDNPEEGICFVLDISERKRLELQFLRAQRMESIGTLSSGVAHDLNNVLSPIIMSISLLKITSKSSETDEILDTIEVCAKRGADIVRQLLSFARGLEGQRSEIQPQQLLSDLEHIIKDTFPKDIRLRFSAPKDAWTILGDPTQVHQVLLNLCVNARDAMPNGGQLMIDVENYVLDEHFAAMDTQAKAGQYIRISVTDSGTGVPQKIIDRIFEPFFTTKNPGAGTGLGLSTVIAIVKSHEGFINVYSEPGKGTTFKVYLPAAALSSGAREEQSEQPEQFSLPRGNGETVLVIDDESSIISITCRTLQEFGYRVLTANDGAEGVAIYAERKNEIAVVLTDMMMPVMDGANVIRVLTRINPAIKIVAASGLASNGSGSKLPGLTIKHFLTKPYTAEILLKTMRSILNEE
jgi:PAS domain S-box-containing protein